MKKNEIYPMSMLHEKLSEEQIKNFSKNYEFNESDKYFHFDTEREFLESLNDEDVNTYNGYVEESQRLVRAVA